jgi:phospholipase A1/A2
MKKTSVTSCALRALLVAALPATANAADDEFLQCTKLPTVEERHACYDQVAARLQARTAGPGEETASSSYLTDAWKLGPNDAAPRHVLDATTYRPSYLIFRQTNSPDTRPHSPATGKTTLPDLDRNMVKIEASFKTELISREAFDWTGAPKALSHVGIDNVRLWFGYTQTMNWQALNHGRSRPIDDANYEPEAILTFGTGNPDNGLKLINLGLSHQSNGIDPVSHRGWSREYVQAGWQLNRLSVLVRAWRVIPQSDDDNPDIRTFYGSGDLVARYETGGGYVTSVLLRRNLGDGHGFTQIDWASPHFKALGGLRIHAQGTTGYGETLLDYNFQQTTVGVGLSFGD